MCGVSSVCQAQPAPAQVQQSSGCGAKSTSPNLSPSGAPESPAVQQAKGGASQLGAHPTPEQFMQWAQTLTPEQQADVKRFFDYVSTHTTEENERLVRYLEGLQVEQSAPVAQAPRLSTGFVYPTADHGKILGRPYQGTHTLGNWQSDNAIDIRVPEGTPIYATTDGVVKKTGGNNNDPSSRFNGFNATLEGSDNAWFYTHMSQLLVHDGQQVKAGDLIGYSGSGNGVPHLHIGQREGNPTQTFQV